MVFVTGDTHGEEARWRLLYQQGERYFTSADTLIVTGDFGYVCAPDGPKHKLQLLDNLAARPYTICFCDGNHEDFAADLTQRQVHFAVFVAEDTHFSDLRGEQIRLRFTVALSDTEQNEEALAYSSDGLVINCNRRIFYSLNYCSHVV